MIKVLNEQTVARIGPPKITHKVVIECNGPECAAGVEAVAKYLKWCCDVGHSCYLIDPDMGKPEQVDEPTLKGIYEYMGVDGDGADRIESVKVEEL